MQAATEIAAALEAALSKHGSTTLLRHWSQVFDREEDSADLYGAVALLQSKLERAIAIMRAADLGERTKQLYANAAQSLLPFVSPRSIANLNISALSGHAQSVNVLFMAGEALPNEATPEVNPITLETLENELNDLAKEVQSSDLPMSLRHAVEAQLLNLLMAVKSFSVLGQDGFARVFGSAMAGTAQAIQATPDASVKQKPTLKKVLSAFQKVGASIVWAGATVGAAHGLVTDGTAIAGLLGLVAPSDTDTGEATL